MADQNQDEDDPRNAGPATCIALSEACDPGLRSSINISQHCFFAEKLRAALAETIMEKETEQEEEEEEEENGGRSSASKCRRRRRRMKKKLKECFSGSKSCDDHEESDESVTNIWQTSSGSSGDDQAEEEVMVLSSSRGKFAGAGARKRGRPRTRSCSNSLALDRRNFEDGLGNGVRVSNREVSRDNGRKFLSSGDKPRGRRGRKPKCMAVVPSDDAAKKNQRRRGRPRKNSPVVAEDEFSGRRKRKSSPVVAEEEEFSARRKSMVATEKDGCSRIRKCMTAAEKDGCSRIRKCMVAAEKDEISAMRKRGRRSLVEHEEEVQVDDNSGALVCLRNGDYQLPNFDSDRDRVRYSFMIYGALRRKIVQEGGEARPDQKAFSRMKKTGLIFNDERKVVGSIPGVHIGDIFYFRMEMMPLCLHKQVMGGIDCLNSKESRWDERVAISVIFTDFYEDNEDLGNGETIIYTGSGGKDVENDGRQFADQKLERGNLGLEKSMMHEVVIRVFRGIRLGSGRKQKGKVFVYDGLYKVNKGWLDIGKAGFGVFRYELERIPNQPPVGSLAFQFCEGWIKDPKSRQNLVMQDISLGQESVQVCVTNDFDETVLERFMYSKTVRYSNTIGKVKSTKGCNCAGPCTKNDCSCIRLNGGQVPYNPDGSLVRTLSVVYECGEFCKCPPQCRNRVSQKGLQKHLEVFRDKDQGWGVRSWEPIPAGSFICEYVGKVLTDSDSDSDDDNSEGKDFLLHVDHTMEDKPIDFDTLYEVCGLTRTSLPQPIRFNIVVDARKIGNVSRFIKHSSFPNLVRQCVLHDHHDPSFPHIMLFAIENIPPMAPLTLNYGPRICSRKRGKQMCSSKTALSGIHCKYL